MRLRSLAVMLTGAVLILHAPSPATAQSGCFIDSNGTRACPVGPDPGGGRDGGEREYVEPEADETPLDPRPAALQQAIPRYVGVVSAMYEKFNTLDKQLWLGLPLNTEADFFNAANQLHKVLVNQAGRNRLEVDQFREALEKLNYKSTVYPRLIAKNRADIEKLRLERDGQAAALTAGQQQLELAQRTSKQLQARALIYAEEAKESRTAILDHMGVLLPPGMGKEASVSAYGAAPAWSPSVPERGADAPPIEVAQAVQAVAAAVPSHVGIVYIDATPAPLSGAPTEAAAQLEADAAEVSSAIAANSSDLRGQVEALRPVSAQLDLELQDTSRERDGLDGEIKLAAGQLRQVNRELLVARDELMAASETFLYQAAEGWIWENAKTEAVQQVKDAARRLAAAKWIGVAYRDVGEEEMRALVGAGKQNIFGLADKALSSGDGLYEVVKRIETLQTHGEGYMQEAARLAARGTPQQIAEFAGRVFGELGDDSEELVKANFGAMEIPEPWKSISAKYFVRAAAE